MNWSLPLGRVFGTEVRAHWSWVLILAFVAVVLGTDLSVEGSLPLGWNQTWAWSTALVGSAGIFASVVVHELGHIVVARRNGMPRPAIVIQLVGSSYSVDARPSGPGAEFRVAASGSALSFVLALLFGGVTLALSAGPVNIDSAPLALQALQFVAFVLALFNGLLGVINLVPGYPLDGAQIAHAILWRRTGDEAKAAEGTVQVSRYVGLGLIGIGVVLVFVADPSLGLCVSLAGWMIAGSSKALDRRSQLRDLVAGLVAGDAIDTDVAVVPPQLTLDVFAAEYLGERSGTAALVERGGEVLGIVGSNQIRRVSRRAWGNTHTQQAMVPIGSVPVVARDSDLWSALEILERAGLDALVVTGDPTAAAAEPTAAAESETHRPVLITRRAAAVKVRERAQARQRELLSAAQTKKGRFRGR